MANDHFAGQSGPAASRTLLSGKLTFGWIRARIWIRPRLGTNATRRWRQILVEWVAGSNFAEGLGRDQVRFAAMSGRMAMNLIIRFML